ncbi:FecR family protein [Duganella sp. P38]|uniref:FecR family protein n=1 Tax=Duganella sp. P38 TaxID=3423949 RepID=UPI003D7B8592
MSEALIALHEQAAQWFLRRSEPGWTGADERALNAWLAASPQHRDIFDGMALTAHDLHQIPLTQDASWRPGAAPGAARATAKPGAAGEQAGQAGTGASARSRWGRRAWLAPALAACAVLAVGAGFGWQHWQNAPAYELQLATAAGETRTLGLPDGSSIALNIDSKLSVRYSNRRREVVLERGEAFFQVARDAGRPFTVASGASQVKVVGTAFNVRAAAAHTVVKVREGRVEVRPDLGAARQQVLLLNPGDGLSIDSASHRARRISAAVQAVGDWRGGHLHFSSTPLSEVASELQRYIGKPVLIDDAALAAQPISGVATTGNPQVFLQALPAALPLRVRQQTDGSWRLSAVR